MLTVKQVARHYRLSTSTVVRRIKSGELHARQVNRAYRLTWEDVWACERGPLPRIRTRNRYQKSLMTKSDLARVCAFSVRTVERWIEDGLPTRCVFGAVRMNPVDVQDWLTRRYQCEFPVELVDASNE